VSYSGLRMDGRRPGESRAIRVRLGFLSRADGSVLLETGQTRVLAAVFGPREAQRRSEQQHDRAHLAVNVT
jgi:exosome complex component RRP41